MPMDQIWIVSILEDKLYQDVKSLWRLFAREYNSVGVQIFSHPHVTFQGGKTDNARQLKKDFQEIASKIKRLKLK
jgi:hypothetical protein